MLHKSVKRPPLGGRFLLTSVIVLSLRLNRHMNEQQPYTPKNKVRIVTAASLFDGHDAAINVMRRIIQSTGCEVIHLGHDRSAEEVVNTGYSRRRQRHCHDQLPGRS